MRQPSKILARKRKTVKSKTTKKRTLKHRKSLKSKNKVRRVKQSTAVSLAPQNPTPEQPPFRETMYPSGRVRNRFWIYDSLRRRVGNYPVVVLYADDDNHTVLDENYEISQSPLQRENNYGMAARKYNISGDLISEFYDIYDGEGREEGSFDDLASFLEGLGNPMFSSERFGPYDYTIGGFQTNGHPQSAVPIACPRENIDAVRSPRAAKEVSKCSTLFKVDKAGDYPIGIILDKMYKDCNFMEDAEIDHPYLITTAKYLQRKLPFPFTNPVRITTDTGNELADAVRQDQIFSSYIPQGESMTGNIKVTYRRAPAIDYGGVVRQFIEVLMERISETMFDVLNMEDQPYAEILDTMTEDEKRKAMNEASKPRYFIRKSSDDELSRLTKVPVADIPKAYRLAGNMFAYAAINQVPLKIPLSRILLKKMLNDNQDVSEEEKLAAYILDTGSNLRRDINLKFEYGGDDVESIKDYLIDMETTLKISSNEAYSVDEARLRNFIDGFKKVGDILRQRNITINELNVMICKTEITREDMEKLVDNLVFEGVGSRTPLVNKIKEAILNIGDYGQLLKWWTGTSAIVNKNYKVHVVEGFEFNFNAHTCFFRFDVNKDIITAPNFLDEFKEEIKNVRLTTL